MGQPPHPPASDLFDEEDDADQRTLVEAAFWNHAKVPDYPPLAHFGRFEILGRIARGGMAEIYLAREWDDDGKARHLVVKRVLPEMQDHPDLLRMFRSEGEIAVRLYHPNVCHVYECGETEGITFMALEWVWGPSLQDVIERSTKKGTRLPWPVGVEIASQVAAALHYVHSATGVAGRPLHIVHRDVSPHNVMMTWTGGVKLLDFGIAKTSQDAGTGGAAVGKYGYMSPEQARSERIDPRSDVFALGVVLYEALSGAPLYDRPTLLDTLTAIVREPVPSLRAVREDIPDALDRIVQRALAKSPADRFQSAGELKAALSQVLRTHSQSVPESRIALTVGALFRQDEKAPLKGDRHATASFQALTVEGAAALASSQESVTYSTFDHAAPPAPVSEVAPIRRSSAAAIPPWVWVALVVLGGLMVGVGAAAAVLLFR